MLIKPLTEFYSLIFLISLIIEMVVVPQAG